MIEDVLKQALEAMNAMLTHMGMDEDEWNKVTFNQMRKAITSIRQAIADLEKQEPVAWTLTEELTKRETTTRAHLWFTNPQNSNWTPLYTTTPQRMPLTVEKILHLVDTHVGAPSMPYPLDNSDWINFARAIEAAHNIKE